MPDPHLEKKVSFLELLKHAQKVIAEASEFTILPCHRCIITYMKIKVYYPTRCWLISPQN